MEFEDWQKLYQENPSRFELLRAQAIEAEINKTPIEYRNKVRLLQWQIEAVRSEHGSTEALQLIAKMMVKCADEMQTAFAELAELAIKK
jgi:hypothetical protein